MTVNFGRLLMGAVATLGALAGLAADAHAALTIGWGATANVHCSGGVCVSSNANAVLGIKDLQRRLANGNLTVVADSLAYDIVVDGAFTWASAHSLELFAAHSIRVNKTIEVAGSGALTLTTNDNLSDGRLTFGAKGSVHFWGTSNPLTIDGKPFVLVNSLPSLISTFAAHPTYNVALTTDYDATPDGIYTAIPIRTQFAGTFEGLGHTISHLNVKPPSRQGDLPAALIDTVKAGAAVSNLRLKSSSFQGRYGSFVGGLAVSNKGTLLGDSVEASFTASNNAYIGGLVWGNYGTIRDCHAVVQMSEGDGTMGGIAANNFDNGVIEDSSAKGTIVGTGYDRIGGLVGSNGSIVRRSWASVAITVGTPATTSIQSAGGGLAGVSGNFQHTPTITDSYADGSVTGGTWTWIGGLIGVANYAGSISNSYSTGAVTTGTSGLVGGFIGNVTGSATFASDYWDTDTSGFSDLHHGAGAPSDEPGIAGLTNLQLKSGLPAGFSSAIWAEDPGVRGHLPYLISNPPY